jgi:hypothetical protein
VALEISEVSKARLKAKASNKFIRYEDSQIKDRQIYIVKGLTTSKYFQNPLTFPHNGKEGQKNTTHKIWLSSIKGIE